MSHTHTWKVSIGGRIYVSFTGSTTDEVFYVCDGCAARYYPGFVGGA